MHTAILSEKTDEKYNFSWLILKAECVVSTSGLTQKQRQSLKFGGQFP